MVLLDARALECTFMKRQRALQLVVAALSLIPALSFGQVPTGNSPLVLQGVWILKSIYKTQSPQGPSGREQRKLLNTRVTYGSSTISACGIEIPIKIVDDRLISEEDFLADTNVRFHEVGIVSPMVRQITINNRQSGSCLKSFPLLGQEVYLTGHDQILIDFEGVFFKAVRVDR
jgi:hypothetical protein